MHENIEMTIMRIIFNRQRAWNLNLPESNIPE